MIMKANKQIGFIYKDEESIDKILKDGEVVFERGFLREKTSTTLPITFGGVGKDLKDYKIYGNTYQNSTSGKNLFDKDNPNIYNGFFSSDGYRLTNSTTSKTIYIACEPNTTYTISRIKGARFRTILVDGEPTQGLTGYDYFMGDNLSTQVHTLTTISTTKYICVFLYNENVDTLTLQEILDSVQIEKSSIATDYEPYTGGQPSPNPDYPQEIISCGDKTKNLCGELEQGGYNETTGAKITSSNYRNKEPIKVLPNTNYIFSINGVGQAINVFEYKVDGTYIGRIGAAVISANTYFTTSSETAYINIFRGTSAGIEKWQIEQSDTVTSYEPYGYKIPVNVRSENLCDGINKKYWLSTTVLSAGMADGNSGLAIELKENTNYTISTQIIQERYRVALINTLPTSGTGIPCYNGVKKDGTKDNITISSSQYKYLILNATDLTKCQIVEGSTAPNKYIPYYNETTNIYLDEPLRKIDEYSDYVDFINGKIVRQLGETVLDGSENWEERNNVSYSNTILRYFYNLSNVDYISRSGASLIKSNYFEGVHLRTRDKNGIARQLDSSGINIFISNTIVSNLSTFKTWLQSHNVIVDYLLSTSTEESITLPNIPTIDGNNILNIETEITPSQVYIKYKSNT